MKSNKLLERVIVLSKEIIYQENKIRPILITPAIPNANGIIFMKPQKKITC